jgi:radical SAM protein with 4Fe4S-binding SPASM domain
MLFDALKFLSILTLKKILNFIGLKFCYYISLVLKKPFFSGYPYSLSIEPTTNCNLSCPECTGGQNALTRSTGNIEPALYSKIINEASPYLLYLMLYFQGEPFLHPELFDMVALAKRNRIYTAVSTNGHFFNDDYSIKTIKSGLNRLIVCIDGITQSTYNVYRKGGNLKKVIDGLKKLISWKKKMKSKSPYIMVQSLVMRHNQHQLKEIKECFNQIGVDKVVFKSLLVTQYKKGNPLIPTTGRYSRYKLSNNGEYIIKNTLRNRCWRMWSSAVVTHDGMVVPCCFDKNAKYVFGNLSESGYKEILKNENYNKFRASILKSRKKIDICCNCTEGMSKVIFKLS